MEDSTLQVVIMALSSFALATFLFYKILRRRRPTSTPPSPPALPVIGHLHLLTDMPHHTFTRLSQKLGPIIYLQLGQVPTVIISSPQLAELILKTHDHIFSSRPQLIAAQYLSFGCSDVTFSRYGPYWRQARKICVTELLSSKRVNSFHYIRDEEINRMLRVISTHSDGELDMSSIFFAVANDILCRVAFGKRFIDGLKEKKEKDLVSVLTETQALLAGFCVGDFFPNWEWINSVSGMKRRLMRNLKDLRRVCEEIIEEHVKRRNECCGDLGKEDFVDVLLRVQKRDDLEVPITDDNLKALVLDMFVAGTDTTSATLEWTMTQLARHPSVLERAKDEVRKIAGNKGKVKESDLQHLHYMKAVIKETMRLHPPVPLLVPRESMDKCTIDDYEIPAKTRILINTYAIGRDPESWTCPLEYNPERFMDKDIDFRGQDFRFLPFGGGRRGCPGYALGLATIELSLARLLYHFDWKLPPGIAAQDVDLSEIFGLATRKRVALKLVPTINKLYASGEEDNLQFATL
ncbi:tryptamine 5-hydroxylase-like [Nicotiana tabacum]|uniref:Cytochrome P450 71A1-like n=1 Tax=Nicotiana tabacum TaxID=4097 RepID=A0A1S3XQL7_TOBAC|nr:PREDICTED: cytochrome P450 71A1-like [Nicotiana tabacum]